MRAQLQVAADQQYISPDEHSTLNELCRRTSGMISNFITHLQTSAYAGEKFTRPRRLAEQTSEKRHQALRAAQLLNVRSNPPPGE